MPARQSPISTSIRQHARAAAVIFIILAGPATIFGQANRSDDDLIQRFRPFIKTSIGRPGTLSGDETFRPASWQFVVGASVLVQEGQGVVKPGLWTAGFPELTATYANGSGSLLVDPTNKAQNHLQIPSSIYEGENWQQVADGDGIYGHVQHIAKTPLVNIEYWIIWARNEDEGRVNLHEGDITAVIVVYDQASDQIVRVTYPAHGCFVASYQIVLGQTVNSAFLSGKDPNLNAIQTPAAQVNVDDANEGDDEKVPCDGSTAPDHHLFLVQDLTSHLYEHPAVYVERGTHESFPNQTGFISLGGAHNGDSVSYLPLKVENLGSFGSPSSADINFLYFNGLFGSDLGPGGLPSSPTPFVEHREWCWPQTCETNTHNIPEGDLDPYEPKLGNLTWPPTLHIAETGDVYVSSGEGLKGSTGAMNSPFVDFRLAYSLTPAVAITPTSPSTKWTIHVSAGPHPGAIVMDRAMTIKSWNGPAILGSPK